MKSENERSRAKGAKPDELPAPQKRFRIEKLEERIAPKKGGKGTHNCGGGGGTSSGSFSGSIY